MPTRHLLSILCALAAVAQAAACTYPALRVGAADARADIVASDQLDASAVDVVADLVSDGDATSDADAFVPPVCPWMLGRSLSVPSQIAMATLPAASQNAAWTCGTPPMMDNSTGEDVYLLQITARRGVSITLTDLSTGADGGATTVMVPFVMLRGACNDVATERACAVAPVVGSGELRVVLEPGIYYVVVDAMPTFMMGATGTAPPSYSLALDDFAMPAANAGCDEAATLTTDAPLTGQSTMGGAVRGAACGTTSGARVYYGLTIPPGQRVRVAAAPMMVSGSEAVDLQLTGDCVAADCLSSSTSSSGTPATASADNPGETPREIVVAVANASSTAADVQFTLSASVEPIPYRETSPTVMCEDLFGAGTTAVTPVDFMMMPLAWSDDSTSPIAPLPFAFSLFGNSLSYFSAESNGLMQLWPSPAATPSATYQNVAFPNTGAPPDAVAPFWDDLQPTSPGAASVRTGTFGTAPARRFVVQWDGFGFFADAGASLRFQVKLFEGSNVVEFHYCLLARLATPDGSAPSSPGRLYGDSATIGLQNRDGTDGVLHSFDRENAVSTATAVRFTPQ